MQQYEYSLVLYNIYVCLQLTILAHNCDIQVGQLFHVILYHKLFSTGHFIGCHQKGKSCQGPITGKVEIQMALKGV